MPIYITKDGPSYGLNINQQDTPLNNVYTIDEIFNPPVGVIAAGTYYNISVQNVDPTSAGIGMKVNCQVLVNGGPVVSIKIVVQGTGYKNGDMLWLSSPSSLVKFSIIYDNNVLNIGDIPGAFIFVPTKGMIGFGISSSFTSLSTTNIINSNGSIISNDTVASTPRSQLAALNYGQTNILFAFGTTLTSSSFGVGLAMVNTSTKINRNGTLTSDSTNAGIPRVFPTAVNYGTNGDGLFFGGFASEKQSSGALDYITPVNAFGDVIGDFQTLGITARGSSVTTTYGYGTAMILGGSSEKVGAGIGDEFLQVSNPSSITIPAGPKVRSSQNLFQNNMKPILPAVAFTIRNYINNDGTITSDDQLLPDSSNKWLVTCGDGVAYGQDKGLFAMGDYVNPANSGELVGQGTIAPGATIPGFFTVNKVSNTGVLAADINYTTYTRRFSSACTYDRDKAVFAYGLQNNGMINTVYCNVTNLVNNQGDFVSETIGVQAKGWCAGAGFGT